MLLLMNFMRRTNDVHGLDKQYDILNYYDLILN